MRMRAILSAVALVAVSATVAQAQQNPVELGVDGQIAIGLDDQGTSINLPLPRIRAGFVIANAMTLEPGFGYTRASDDDGAISNMIADISLLYHFSPDRRARQFYLRPVVGLQRVALSSDVLDIDESSTDMNIGLGAGVKIPLMDRVSTRLEAEFRNYMSDPSVSALNLNFGLSFFTR